MKDVIVVSAMTERRHMIDEYEDQLAAAGIDHYIHPVTLDNGIVSITARWKFTFVADMCQQFRDYSRIVFTDAWDVLFFGNRWDFYEKLPIDPIISAERNCWPETGVMSNIDGPWRYFNAGMMGGHPKWLREFAEESLKDPDADLMEQAWLNRKKLDDSQIIDYRTKVFYTVSYDREDGLLCLRDGKPYNWAHDTYPQLFHFAGPCSSVPFRKMLRTGEPLCASV
jgi:hypothetical protein